MASPKPFISKLTGVWAPLVTIGFALFTDGFLYQMLIPLTPLSKVDVLDVGQEEVLYIGYAISVLVLTAFFSWIANRVGYKQVLVGGAVLQITSTTLFALSQDFETLLIARFLQGASASVTWTVGLALIADSYPKLRVRTMGYMMWSATFGLIAGPIVGGILIEYGGSHTPFIFAIIVTFVDLLFRCVLLAHLRKLEVVRFPLFTLLRNRQVLVSAAVVVMVGWSWSGAIEPVLPAKLAHTFEASGPAIGLIFTISSVAYALVTWWVEYFKQLQGLWPTIGLGVIVMAVGMPLLMLCPNLIWITIVLCLISIAYALAINPTVAALADTVDRCAVGAYASVYAIFNIAYSAGTIGGDVVTIALVHQTSLKTAFLLLSAFLIATLPLIRWGFKPPRPKLQVA